MLISQALRIAPKDVVTLVGGGGKTTLMFRLAGELQAAGRQVVTTMTTRIFVSQMRRAPHHMVFEDECCLLADLPGALKTYGHVLVAGSVQVEKDKVAGIPPGLVDQIIALPGTDAIIVEGDGSRRLPFKAPADHEPVVPESTTILVPMIGLDVLGQPLDAQHVHRPERVAELSGARIGEPVTAEMVARVLAHVQGGAKSLPAGARLVPFLNQADDPDRLAAACEVARLLLAEAQVESVLIGAAEAPEPVQEVWSRAGAVILAAGQATRYGSLKQLLPWDGLPLVSHVVGQALACTDVARVVVSLGAGAEEVGAALGGQPVRQVRVEDWQAGQSRSVRAGLQAVQSDGEIDVSAGSKLGAVIFLLVDQPGVTPALLSALVQRHRETLAPAVVPRYAGRRGNPALFDRATFAEFVRLEGDIGARPILQAHAGEIAWLDWPTAEVVEDIDTVEDYARARGITAEDTEA
jgi:molybdenum cofactor cytidylyltransferase